MTIHGFRYRVMATDTNLNWMLIRIRADSLLPPTDPASTAIGPGERRRAVRPEHAASRFERRGHRPRYFKPDRYKATPGRRSGPRSGTTPPTTAIPFFEQLGRSLKLNPLPTARTGLNGIPLGTLPSWVVPQAGAKKVFRNPAFGQRRTLARFKAIGLTADGFTIPRGWRQKQLTALQTGFEAGQRSSTRS